MTVSAYFDRHAYDGRAALGRYNRLEPPTWISRATFRGRVSYWLCKRDYAEIERLDPNQDVATLRTQPYRLSRDPVRMVYDQSVSA